jgi:hypothetical protein
VELAEWCGDNTDHGLNKKAVMQKHIGISLQGNPYAGFYYL